MSRLPDLERSLFDAARRLEAAADGAGGTAPRWGRWRRRGTPLLATAALVVAGGAVAAAAVSGLLDTGDPVPVTRDDPLARIGKLKPGTAAVLPLRVADPDGGPAWGIGVFDVSTRAQRLGHVSVPNGTMRCVRVGRVQDGVLGVVGRDRTFNDDGRFHPLSAASLAAGGCIGAERDGQLLFSAGGAPTPASGNAGRVPSPVGGCRMYGLPKRWVSSPQTRRKLRGVPRCPGDGRRIVKYGFAGREATSVRFANDKLALTLKPGAGGAYLFVIRPQDAGSQPMKVTVTYRDGTACTSPRLGPTLRHPAVPGDPCTPPPGF